MAALVSACATELVEAPAMAVSINHHAQAQRSRPPSTLAQSMQPGMLSDASVLV
jgi:hypothetical protein